MNGTISDDFPPLFSDPTDYQRFRDTLEAVCYTDEDIFRTLAVMEYASVRLADRLLLLHRTNQGTRLDTAIRLFLVNVPVELQSAQRSLQPVGIEALVEAGLLRIEGNTVVATVRLRPLSVKLTPPQLLFIAHDQPLRLQSPSRQDFVMGVADGTMVLAYITVRKKIGACLDLGTGCGLHALLASRHSERVAAVDINPRAVGLAAFNAGLNGAHNVECLEGDLFQPVKDRKFDLIVSNPPWVITPGLDYLYRDSGMQGDQMCRRIVREAPDYLNEGGYCHMLCNWVESPEGDWAENLSRWFEGTGCDVWVIRTATEDAPTYAAKWIRHTEPDRPGDPNRLFEEWMRYYEEQGIKAIGYGLITMRRRGGRANWFRAGDGPETMIGPCGDLTETVFQLNDFLETMGDDSSLLDTAFIISPDARLEMQFSPSSGGWAEVGSPRLRLARGLSIPGSIDSFLPKLIIGCNGQNRLGSLVTELADYLGSDPATVAPPFCKIVRRLVEQGFLLPAHLI